VDDRIEGATTWYRHETLPAHGRIYTIRGIVPCIARGFDEDGLHLVEIVNRPRRWPEGRRTELAFRISRFRPLRSTNIDVFLQMLEPTRVLEVEV
jgi:hypothetical protein